MIKDDRVVPGDTVESAIDEYRRTWLRSDAVVAAASSLDELCLDTGDDCR